MKIYNFPTDYNKNSEDFRVSWQGNNIPVYNCDVSAYPFNRVWQGKQRPFNQTEKASFISFGSDTEVSLLIEPKATFNDVIIRPLSKNINHVINGNNIIVKFPAPGQYSVELDGIHNTLTVFINPETEFKIDKSDKNILYFPPGIHIFDERIELKDGQTIFIDEDAVLMGSINATDKNNISIVGYGILDNSRMNRANEINGCAILDPNSPKQTGNPIFLNRCKNIVIDGVTIVDSSGWNIYLDGCENITINNIKLIGMWRYNADGCDFCNCTNGLLQNSYLRTFDDCVTVKGFKLNNHLPVQNITVQNCVLWCDWGRALEVGAETCAPYIKDVLFCGCDIIHGSDVMLDIQHGDASNITNVKFKNINIEYSGNERKLVIQESDNDLYPEDNIEYTPIPFTVTTGATMWSIDTHAGNVFDISFEDINITTPNGLMPQGSSIYSKENTSLIKNICFKNILINGKKCQFDDLNLHIGNNVTKVDCI